MTKSYEWVKTTTGHVMRVDGKNRWFIRNCDGGFEVYEVVWGEDGCLLRDIAFSLPAAKRRAYLIECQEQNGRRCMELATTK